MMTSGVGRPPTSDGTDHKTIFLCEEKLVKLGQKQVVNLQATRHTDFLSQE